MAVYPQVVLTPDPVYLHAETYSAQDDRRDRQESVWPGVFGSNDFKISFVSGRTVRTAAGVAYIKGRNVADQGFYRMATASTFDVTHNAGDGSNPRIDQVILRVMDNAHDSAGFNEPRMEAVPGTPTPGTTLDTRAGALNLDALGEASKNYLLLADVLVPTGATTINASDIRDRRVFCVQGIPPLLTEVDCVGMQAAYGTVPMFGGMDNNIGECIHPTHDLRQAFYLGYLPRRITATKIRWKYVQGVTTALAGNYRIAIYDASGYKMVETASTAWTGAAVTQQERSETITSTIFDPGMYYIGFGVDTSAGSARYPGVTPAVVQVADNWLVGAYARNLALGVTSGGVTLPATLLALTDVGGQTASLALPGAPMIVLSDA